MRKIFKSVITIIIFYIDCLIGKNKNYYAFSSYPDLTDNSFALFKHLFNNRNSNSKFIWLLGDGSMQVELYKQMIIANLPMRGVDLRQIVFAKKNSIIGLYWYFRSRYVFFTHGLYPDLRFPKRHILINLWHGMSLKNIGKLDGKDKVPQFTFTIATSTAYQEIMAKAFDVKNDQVLNTGQPRCDLLFENYNTLLRLGIEKEKYTKVVFWAPTYRQSRVDIRCDGASSLGFPALLFSDMEEFNNHLAKLSVFLIIKIHPMDVLNLQKMQSYSNILIVTNELLLNKSIQLYNLLGECDILMTDYSSIYIDFLLIDKPIVFVFKDYENYQNSRGFVFENATEMMPGYLVFNFNDLKKILEDLTLNESDVFKVQRAQVNTLFNEFNKNFSAHISNIIIYHKG